MPRVCVCVCVWVCRKREQAPSHAFIGPGIMSIYITEIWIGYILQKLLSRKLLTIDFMHLFQPSLHPTSVVSVSVSILGEWFQNSPVVTCVCHWKGLASSLPPLFIGSPLAIMEKALVSNIRECIYPLTRPGLPTLTQWCLRHEKTLGFTYRKFYRNVHTSVLTTLYHFGSLLARM